MEACLKMAINKGRKTKLVIFDQGGTIINYGITRWDRWDKVLLDKCILNCYKSLRNSNILKDVNKSLFTKIYREIMRGSFFRTRAEDRLKKVLQYFSIQPSERQIKDLTTEFYAPVSRRATMMPNADTVLTRLKQEGLTIALVSDCPWGVPSRLLRADLERFSLDRYFDIMVYSSDYNIQKPDPMIFKIATKHVNFKPSEVLMVGDNLVADVFGGHSLGFRTVLLKHPSLKGRADSAVWWKIIKPDYVISDLIELLGILSLSRKKEKT
jgi:FMN phosphatase YigB (HAD superfamily)